MPDPLKVVFVDNVDSFTYNLVDEFSRRGAEVEVWRNTVPARVILDRALGADGCCGSCMCRPIRLGARPAARPEAP